MGLTFPKTNHIVSSLHQRCSHCAFYAQTSTKCTTVNQSIFSQSHYLSTMSTRFYQHRQHHWHGHGWSPESRDIIFDLIDIVFSDPLILRLPLLLDQQSCQHRLLSRHLEHLGDVSPDKVPHDRLVLEVSFARLRHFPLQQKQNRWSLFFISSSTMIHKFLISRCLFSDEWQKK